jgi:stearoyl-CoA desaturase (Delta-9 desaturase)
MAVLAFGEGYHNFHHSFPFDYRNGIKRRHFDPAKWVIYGLSRLGLARNLRRASDAAILKAKIEVQFETAKEKMARVVSGARQSYEKRLHEAHTRLQSALHELLALQRRPAREVFAGDDQPETRLGMIHHALEQALREWKKTLRQMNRASTATAA